VKTRRRDASRVVRQAAAVCLGYPERDVIAKSGLLRAALAESAPREPASFEPLLAFWDSSDLAAIQTHYVDVFDLSRKHSLYLSYWTDGDTRRRGEVLAAFKQRYRRSGFLVDTGGELPDYLPMVLEYAAIVDPSRWDRLAAGVPQQRGVAAVGPGRTPHAVRRGGDRRVQHAARSLTRRP
jgi:nitrate reductase molybdenum cofactor assembly chaperone